MTPTCRKLDLSLLSCLTFYIESKKKKQNANRVKNQNPELCIAQYVRWRQGIENQSVIIDQRRYMGGIQIGADIWKTKKQLSFKTSETRKYQKNRYIARHI